MPLEIDFFAIWVDFGGQVGMQNSPKSVWLSVARRHGEAWRGVARRGEARRGEAWLGRRGAKIGPRCVEGGGVYPTLKGGTSPGVWTQRAPTNLDFELRLFGHLVALLFFIVFSMPFLIDLGSILPPNLAPKIHQNR